MGSCSAAILHLLLLAVFGSLVVATPVPLNLLALLGWALVVRAWAGRWSRTHPHGRVNSILAIQMAGMIALVVAAAFAPGKVVDRQKARIITLPKQVMTLGELAAPVQHGWPRFYDCSVSVPDGMGDRAVHFPSRELTVGEFIQAIEAQAPLWHRFGHCGNGSSILWGGDCSFGLQFHERSR